MKLAPMILAVSFVLATPAMAQDAPVTVTLQAQGDVMVSTGGEFATAASGTQLAVGNRVMVGEGGVARLVYSTDCQEQYADPGVYTVDGNCTRVAAVPGSTDWASAGIIAGGVALGAAALSQMDEVDVPEAPPASR